jgi:hypothetical protein
MVHWRNGTDKGELMYSKGKTYPTTVYVMIWDRNSTADLKTGRIIIYLGFQISGVSYGS